MTTLTSDHLISEITAELSGLPYAQRVAAAHAYQKLLDEPEAAELKYARPLHAVTELIIERNPTMIW